MQFIALDFETANADLSSICQIGLVGFNESEIVTTFSSLINPHDYFDPMNVSIHGIDEDHVRDAPSFQDIYPDLYPLLDGAVVVCHTFFDRAVIQQASAKFGLRTANCRWLDTTRVVRRTWEKYAQSGYALKNLATDFEIAFQHHDAAEDARATGLILLKAIKETGISLEDWIVRCEQPIHKIAQEANPDGILAGEVIVFTGALSLPRHDAAHLAALAGCKVDSGVTKETTLLVVGDQDVKRLAPGAAKSTKHIKAESLIAKGQPIRVLRETDFLQLVKA